MIGVHVGQCRAFIDCQRRVAEPDVFPDKGAGHFRDDMAEYPALRMASRVHHSKRFTGSFRPPCGPLFTPDVMRRRGGRCGGFDAQFLEAVIGPGGLERRADGQRLDATGVVDGVIVGGRATQVLRDIAARIVGEGPCGGRALFDGGALSYLARVNILQFKKSDSKFDLTSQIARFSRTGAEYTSICKHWMLENRSSSPSKYAFCQALNIFLLIFLFFNV